jgi:hypothetical protein
MSDKKPPEQHSKLADIERLRLMRYMTKGAGSIKAPPVPKKPTVDQLRSKVAKVAKKTKSKKKKR